MGRVQGPLKALLTSLLWRWLLYAVESLEVEVFRSKGHSGRSGNKIHPGVHLSRKLSSTEQKCDTAANYQDGIVAERQPPQRGGTTSPYLDP